MAVVYEQAAPRSNLVQKIQPIFNAAMRKKELAHREKIAKTMSPEEAAFVSAKTEKMIAETVKLKAQNDWAADPRNQKLIAAERYRQMNQKRAQDAQSLMSSYAPNLATDQFARAIYVQAMAARDSANAANAFPGDEAAQAYLTTEGKGYRLDAQWKMDDLYMEDLFEELVSKKSLASGQDREGIDSTEAVRQREVFEFIAMDSKKKRRSLDDTDKEFINYVREHGTESLVETKSPDFNEGLFPWNIGGGRLGHRSLYDLLREGELDEFLKTEESNKTVKELESSKRPKHLQLAEILRKRMQEVTPQQSTSRERKEKPDLDMETYLNQVRGAK